MASLGAKLKQLFAPIDLTKGKILPTLLWFMIPIALSTIFQQIYTISDAIIVGQSLESHSIAGINASTPMYFIVIQFAYGAASGFSVVIGERIGAKNEDGTRRSFLTQMILCIAISGILTLLGLIFLDPLLSILHIVPSATDPAMQAEYEAAHNYVFVLYVGIYAQMLYNAMGAILRAKGDSITPFLVLAACIVLNIGLDILFIKAFSLGVIGVALATIISQGLSAIVCLIYGLYRYEDLRVKKADWKSLNWGEFWHHIKLGLPLGLQFSILSIGMIVMQSAIIEFDRGPNGMMLASMPAQLGYSAACKLDNIFIAVLASVGTAMLAFAAQNYGAKRFRRVKEGYIVSMKLGGAFWLLSMAIGFLLSINGAYQYIFLAGDKISEASIAYGNAYLYVCLPSLVFLMALFVHRNMLQGIEKSVWAIVAGVSEMVARCAVCLLLPLFVKINSETTIWAFVGISSADAVSWFAAAVVMLPPLLRFFRKNPEDIAALAPHEESKK